MQPTHRGHILDLVISKGLNISKVLVSDVALSDHYRAFFENDRSVYTIVQTQNVRNSKRLNSKDQTQNVASVKPAATYSFRFILTFIKRDFTFLFFFFKDCMTPDLIQIAPSLRTKKLKTAVIKRLLKNNLETSVMNDYRPISNLPILNQIIENVVFQQLNNYLIINVCFDVFQPGCRPQHSTDTALVTDFYDIHLNTDSGKMSVSV